MANIPFEISDSRGHRISGLLSFDDEFIVFEVQEQKRGFRKKPPETVKAEFSLVDTIRLTPGIFWDSIYVVPKRMDMLRAFPGYHKNELKLKIAKRYREEADQLVASVQQRKLAN